MTIRVRCARKPIPATLALSCLALLCFTDSAAEATPSFADALPIAFDETLRGEGRAVGEPDCYRLEAPSAGLLMLDVAVPGRAEAEPRLALFAAGLSTQAVRLSVIEQSATHLLALSHGPQSLRLCVGAQDPLRRLGDYKLHTAFQGIESSCPYRDKSTDPEPIEVEPEGLRGCVNPDFSTDPEPIEVEPEGLRTRFADKSTDPEPIAAFRLRASGATEPEGLGARGPLEELCNSGERDDHADAFLCATPLALGLAAHGELHNGWGDDHDFFSFELTGARTVRIEASGEIDIFGGLYDQRGQRLAVAGGEGADFRLFKTLPAGLYFVRIEAGPWQEGAYRLAVDALTGSW